MRCKCCSEPDCLPLWMDVDGYAWERCLACGSDTSAAVYEPVRYGLPYIDQQVELGEDEASMSSNLDWFDHHKDRCPNNSFLDIGCSTGSALTGMQSRGWAVHGFEVFEPPYMGAHVTVGPHFRANLFPQRYAAILCREVIEHVPDWRQFLAECHLATATGGLFQVQTPRPGRENHKIPYQASHLQLLSPILLRYWLERLGFTVIDFRLWGFGQVFMCRR